jgi:hypothetical protein
MANKKFGIAFTGFVKKEIFSPNEPFRCYICKRHDGEESTHISLEDGEVRHSELKVGVLVGEEKGYEINYPLCTECSVLLSNFSRMKCFVNDESARS